MSKTASSTKLRDKLPKTSFADPTNRKFPIVDGKDVKDAARLIGHAAHPEAVKKNIIKIAKRKGLESSIPKSWTKSKTK